MGILEGRANDLERIYDPGLQRIDIPFRGSIVAHIISQPLHFGEYEFRVSPGIGDDLSEWRTTGLQDDFDALFKRIAATPERTSPREGSSAN
jgi:hypothetical protein